jgi:hypothetical protein
LQFVADERKISGSFSEVFLKLQQYFDFRAYAGLGENGRNDHIVSVKIVNK